LDPYAAVDKICELKTDLKAENPGKPIFEVITCKVTEKIENMNQHDVEEKICEVQEKVVELIEENQGKMGRALSQQTSKVFRELFKGEDMQFFLGKCENSSLHNFSLFCRLQPKKNHEDVD